MMIIDNRIFTFAQCRVVKLANWSNSSTAAKNVWWLCWNSAMEKFAHVMHLFPMMETFMCRESERCPIDLKQDRYLHCKK